MSICRINSILIMCLAAATGAWGSTFRDFNIDSSFDDLIVCDINGDSLKDLILIKWSPEEGSSLAVFIQQKSGFANSPDSVFQLGKRAVIACVGANGLYLIDRAGVSTLNWNQTGLVCKKIIDANTLVPETGEAIQNKLSLKTPAGKDLILIPTAAGLEVWAAKEKWCRIGIIADSKPDEITYGPTATAGYIRTDRLNLSISDINGDGLEDVVICKHENRKNIYNVYPQTKDGTIQTEPSQSFKVEQDDNTRVWIGDLNGDGRADMIRSTRLQEDSGLPFTESGKVIVEVLMCDANGQLPKEPSFVFRKNDRLTAVPVVDIDGDGLKDIVLGYTMFDSREDVKKSLTAREFEYNLQVHFGGNFRKEPDFQRELEIETRHIELMANLNRRNIQRAMLSFDGDFNGDGKKDLLVKDKDDAASVFYFISRQKGFSRKPDIEFKGIERPEQLIVDDLNNDGISDLIDVEQSKQSLKVFISGKK